MFENPFRDDHKPRKPGVAGLVGDFFGEGAKRALERKIVEKKRRPVQLEENWGDITMSQTEREKVEQEVDRENWTREKYVTWAKKQYKNETWVDAMFEFQDDGTAVCTDDLDLSTSWTLVCPKGLVLVNGHLTVTETTIPATVTLPPIVMGDFLADNSTIASFRGFPRRVDGNVSLAGAKVTSLAGLSMRIGGDIDLSNIPATEFPMTVSLGGEILLRKRQTALAEDAKRKKYRVRFF